MSMLLYLLKDESGSNAIEYCLLMTIISTIAIGSMTEMGVWVEDTFYSMVTNLR